MRIKEEDFLKMQSQIYDLQQKYKKIVKLLNYELGEDINQVIIPFRGSFDIHTKKGRPLDKTVKELNTTIKNLLKHLNIELVETPAKTEFKKIRRKKNVRK
jgi:uncharacterized FlaG/YvyC family protein